jgi:hypothetical protein
MTNISNISQIIISCTLTITNMTLCVLYLLWQGCDLLGGESIEAGQICSQDVNQVTMHFGREGKGGSSRRCQHLCHIASISSIIVKNLKESSCGPIEVLYRHLYGCEETKKIVVQDRVTAKIRTKHLRKRSLECFIWTGQLGFNLQDKLLWYASNWQKQVLRTIDNS